MDSVTGQSPESHSSSKSEAPSGFAAFNFVQGLNDNLASMGYVTPTPIQRATIPDARAGHDVMGLAQTGTGKTAAFLLPIIERLAKTESKSVRALVVAPTRELAEQIDTVARQFSRGSGITSCTIYGGVSMGRQVHALRRGIDLVVGCPGRIVDHLQQRTLDLSKVEVLVLDEADHMFDLGFLDSVRKILRALPAKRQTLLFSATMPSAISGLAREILNNPKIVEVDRPAPARTVQHELFSINQDRKSDFVKELIGREETEAVLIFTRTKHRAKRLAAHLHDSGLAATSLQGNLSQPQRQRALDGFRSGKFQVMVATDIAARGIDLQTISHVINYDMPDTVEAYTHRSGRTGRAARRGVAITLASGEDRAMVRQLQNLLKDRLISHGGVGGGAAATSKASGERRLGDVRRAAKPQRRSFGNRERSEGGDQRRGPPRSRQGQSQSQGRGRGHRHSSRPGARPSQARPSR